MNISDTTLECGPTIHTPIPKYRKTSIKIRTQIYIYIQSVVLVSEFCTQMSLCITALKLGWIRANLCRVWVRTFQLQKMRWIYCSDVNSMFRMLPTTPMSSLPLLLSWRDFFLTSWSWGFTGSSTYKIKLINFYKINIFTNLF